MTGPFDTSSYSYDIPKELIAQYPQKRSDERLLIVDRKSGKKEIFPFVNIIERFSSGDVMVFNDTKVFPARFYGRKSDTNAKIEIMLIKSIGENWHALSRPYKRLKEGSRVIIADDLYADIIELKGNGNVLIRFNQTKNFFKFAQKYGHIPLPPYIKRQDEHIDRIRYQTVFAKNTGAVAAPTAGLHFTDDLLKELKNKGVKIVFITLHTGAGTFNPINTDDIRDFKIHSEYFSISPDNIEMIKSAKRNSKRVFACGTTSVRTLEYVYKNNFNELEGNCDLYIYPGFEFKATDCLITNFHQPRTSLLALVCTFAGYESTMSSYRFAMENKMKFYSYGDAMLIL